MKKFVNKGENNYSEIAQDPVLFYGGEYGYCFSNFAAFNVQWKGRVWQTAEHAFQAAGFNNKEIIEAIASAKSAHEALMLAISHRDELQGSWDDEMYDVMKDICRHKIEQHEYIKSSLLRTGKAELIEDSPKDEVWGRGENWNGRNLLGKIWMELREEIERE